MCVCVCVCVCVCCVCVPVCVNSVCVGGWGAEWGGGELSVSRGDGEGISRCLAARACACVYAST